MPCDLTDLFREGLNSDLYMVLKSKCYPSPILCCLIYSMNGHDERFPCIICFVITDTCRYLDHMLFNLL